MLRTVVFPVGQHQTQTRSGECVIKTSIQIEEGIRGESGIGFIVGKDDSCFVILFWKWMITISKPTGGLTTKAEGKDE